MIGKNKLMALTLMAMIFLSGNFASATVNIISNVQIKPSSANATDVINCSATYNDFDSNKGNVSMSWYNGSTLYWQVTQFNKANGTVVDEPLTWYNKTGLVGYWKFSEGNGIQVRDISGNENNGTLNNFNWNANSGWVNGKFGKALQFDGSNDYVSVSDSANWNISTNNYTISMWINPSQISSNTNRLISSWNGGSSNYATSQYVFAIDNTGRIFGSFGNGAGWGFALQTSAGIISTNNWYNIQFVFDTTLIKNYVNGVLQVSVARQTLQSSQKLQIGGWAWDIPYGGVNRYFNGTIDEVMIYNRSLSSAEINESMVASPHARGETWNCTINATDSTGSAGLPNSTTRTISDSAPNITSITIAPSPAYTDSTLNCSAVYGDPEGNKGNVTLSWYNGSSLFLQTTQYNKFSGESINEPLTWVDRNGLVGYWKFSEGNGTQTRDISGNENNGALTNFNFNANSGWVDGKYGKAVQFDGSNDYVDVGNAASLNPSLLTVEAWFKLVSPSALDTIVGRNPTSGTYEYFLYVDSSAGNKVGFGVGNSVGAPVEILDGPTISTGIWYHAVGTYDGSKIHLYLNGVEYGTSQTVNSLYKATDKTFIGKYRPSGGTHDFNGTIDEVRIYNRSLSADEILALYSNSPHAVMETWNCTINATDSQESAGLPNSKTITIGSQSAQNYTPKWMHVTVTYNKATRQKKIYVNGNLTKTETLQGLSNYKINNQTGNLYVGKLYGLPAGNPFNGSVDEILISQKEKSAPEIWQDYLNNIIYSEMPGPNEAKTMAIEGGNITEISIAPIVKVRNKEKTCDVTSKVNLPECVQ